MVGNPVQSFNCPSCGKPIPVYAKSLSVAAACGACGAIVDIKDENYQILFTARAHQTIEPAIPLGTKGTLLTETLQVIGFMRRFEPSYEDEPWDEYLLFNPYLGYRWLVCANGHWTFFKMIKAVPEESLMRNDVTLNGQHFRTYHIGSAKTAYVIGEFYWQVKVGELERTLDAIAPPLMISSQESGGEKVWSLGEYVQPDVVKAAFKLDKIDSARGIAPNQPAPYAPGEVGKYWKVFLVAAAAGYFCFCVFWKVFPQEQLLNQSIPFSSFWGGSRPEQKIGELELGGTGPKSATLTVLQADISSNWVEAGIRFVKQDGTEEYDFEKELSFYSGVDSDGSWSENNSHAELLASEMKPGKYDVMLAVTLPMVQVPGFLDVTIYRSPTLSSNYWLALFFLCIPPSFIFYRAHRFESKRWTDSEFNPHAKSDSKTDD